MIYDILKITKNLSLIKRMAYKEITDRYAGSALGILWTILQPLILISVYVVVFTFVFKVRISDGSPVQYAFYAIAGLIPWIAFAEGISKSVTSVSGKSPLVKQAIFPVEILPLVTSLTCFLPLLVGFTIYILGALIINPGQINTFILILPFIILINFIFIAGLSYFLAIGGVYFRDLTEVISLLITIGLFATPILYLEQSIPRAFALPMKLNLIAHLIFMYRDAVFYGQLNHPWSFIIFTSFALIFFILGFNAFKKVKHLFANVL